MIVGIDADSGELLTYQTSTLLAELIGASIVEFPRDHAGFLGSPAEFAEVLGRVLAGVDSTMSGAR